MQLHWWQTFSFIESYQWLSYPLSLLINQPLLPHLHKCKGESVSCSYFIHICITEYLKSLPLCAPILPSHLTKYTYKLQIIQTVSLILQLHNGISFAWYVHISYIHKALSAHFCLCILQMHWYVWAMGAIGTFLCYKAYSACHVGVFIRVIHSVLMLA